VFTEGGILACLVESSRPGPPYGGKQAIGNRIPEAASEQTLSRGAAVIPNGLCCGQVLHVDHSGVVEEAVEQRQPQALCVVAADDSPQETVRVVVGVTPVHRIPDQFRSRGANYQTN